MGLWVEYGCADTIKKYYLSLTERSERIQRLRVQVREYSDRFNGNYGNF